VGLAYLTADLPGTGGALKSTREDFVVDEIPLYEPSGRGEHLFVRVRKRGFGTFEAVRRLAEALGIREGAVGYAGLKDSRAVTSQWLSVPGSCRARLDGLSVRGLEVLEAHLHGNKLRIGHLRGNRFAIVVRQAAAGAPERAAAILDALVRRGVPNYFGEQRFGSRGTSYLVGEAIVRQDWPLFCKRFLGEPSGQEVDPHLREARELYEAGRLEEAYEAMPMRRRPEKKCLHALLRFRDPHTAYLAIPKRMRQMYVSSFQSMLFNRIVERRVSGIDTLVEGDLAFIHRSHRVFPVEDLAAELPRCRAFEISPSAPLFGTRVPLAGGAPGEIERETLAATGLQTADFDVGPGMQFKGLRRSARMPLKEVALAPLSETSFRVEFSLESGSFATAVLREITKADDL